MKLVGLGLETSVDVGGGVQVPGGAIAAASYEFYKKPSAEGAANAAMRAMCGVATAGAGAVSNICSYFSVANILAAGDWFAANVLDPVGLTAKGVFECTFYLPDVKKGAEDTILAMQTALDKSWYATRAAMRLPFKPNTDATVVYTPATKAYQDASGYWHGVDAPAKLAGSMSKRVGQILAKDNDWNSSPSVVWPDSLGPLYAGALKLMGKRTLSLTAGNTDWTMSPSSSPFIDCQGFAPQFNSLLGGLYTRYRLEPARKAVQQVLGEWGAQFDAEYNSVNAKNKQSAAALTAYATAAQKASDSNKIMLALIVAGLAVGVGAAYARKKRKS